MYQGYFANEEHADVLEMVSIVANVEINADVERVWELVSDVDNDVEYWKGLNSVKNVRKGENMVERTVKVGFMGSEGRQLVTLHPKKKTIELLMTKGPLKGSREIKLEALDNGSKTKLGVTWDFQFSGIPPFARGFVKTQLERTTGEALEKIAQAAEGNLPPKSRVSLVTSSN